MTSAEKLPSTQRIDVASEPTESIGGHAGSETRCGLTWSPVLPTGPRQRVLICSSYLVNSYEIWTDPCSRGIPALTSISVAATWAGDCY